MFKKAQAIDSAFQLIRTFCLAVIILCGIICCFVLYVSHKTVNEAQSRILILANGKALEAYGADRKDNIPVEARDHIKTFHQDFFTLDPDEKVINSNITRALYLADRSAKKQYDNLKESGYYSNLITANISQQIEADSIEVNLDAYPYHFRFSGEEKLIRFTFDAIKKRHFCFKTCTQSGLYAKKQIKRNQIDSGYSDTYSYTYSDTYIYRSPEYTWHTDKVNESAFLSP